MASQHVAPIACKPCTLDGLSDDLIVSHGFVPNLSEYLAACDLAPVQGSLSTTIELVAARRPFLYPPTITGWTSSWYSYGHAPAKHSYVTRPSTSVSPELTKSSSYLPISSLKLSPTKLISFYRGWRPAGRYDAGRG